MIARSLPKYCVWNADRHGTRRVRFRKGTFAVYLPGIPYSDEFNTAYHKALQGDAKQLEEAKAAHVVAGSIDTVVISFYRSSGFLKLKETTRRVMRNTLERFRVEHGKRRVSHLQASHLQAIIGAMSDRPAAANNLLKILRILLRHAIDMGLIADNPARNVRKFKESGVGAISWTDSDIASFKAIHGEKTKARLALNLLFYTSQRRGDVVRMGWQHVEGDKISVKQEKTGAKLRLPIHPEMMATITSTPRKNLTFLLTEQGAPFSPAGFGNWFRMKCDEAGLKHCSAHGLRKAFATRLADADCTPEQIKSMTGHKTLTEVARYTAAADQEKNARIAMNKLMGAEREQVSPAFQIRLDKKGEK